MNPQMQLIIQQAIGAFQHGDLDKADSILKRALLAEPKSLPALHILGLIRASQSRFQEAADLLGRAARINPNEASIQYNLAKALVDSGADREALPHHKKTVELVPNNPEAWLNYGKSASNLGRYADAITYYDQAIKLKPDYAEAHLNKGAVFKELKQFDDAILSAEKALEIKPNLAEAWSNKGVALKELKRYEEALTSFKEALRLQPNFPQVYLNKGNVLHELAQYQEAISEYDQAINLQPDFYEAWFNRGVSLAQLPLPENALASYDKAISIKEDYDEAWFNKAITLNKLKRFEEAIAHYDMAIKYKPEFADAWSNKAATLNEMRSYEDAISHYENALKLKPDLDWTFGYLLHLKMAVCFWSDLLDDVNEALAGVRSRSKLITPFPVLSLIDDSNTHKECAEIYVEDSYPLNPILGEIPKIKKQEKILVGYFSADFREHAVSLLMAELYELHDKTKFEIIAFSSGPDDKSHLRKRLMRSFDQFIDISGMSDKNVAILSRALGVQIAVNLGGYTGDNRPGIFAFRAAPIQVNYLGYPGTLGATYIDYIVADKVIIPSSSQQFYTEKIAYLPHTYMVDDSLRVSSQRVFSREECGLPDDSFIFCSFNNGYKYNKQLLESWARILSAVSGSVLWLSDNGDFFRKNLIAEFEALGIVSKRLVFTQKIQLMSDHLARYALANLFLDTYPYNAHTTAVDSLKSGVPIITCLGQAFAGRVAASILNAIGLTELVTKTPSEYEMLAIDLAKNPQKLASITQKLSSNYSKTPLFNTPLFAKNIESVYKLMVERYEAGLPPDHIYVK